MLLQRRQFSLSSFVFLLVMKKVVSVKATPFYFTCVIKVRALSFGSNEGVFLGAIQCVSTTPKMP